MRTLAAFAASGAPLAERLHVARDLARAVAALHARGRVHGALSPERALVVEDGAVVLEDGPAGEPHAARAGFEAPEVARGGRPSPRADAFSLGALVWLTLAGRPPFDAAEPLERIRRALFAAPGSVRLHAPRVGLELDAALVSALEKRPGRRVDAAGLAGVLEGASTPTPTATPAAAASPLLRHLPTFAAAAAGLSRLPAAVRRLPPLPRLALAALPALALGLALLPESDALLAREVASLVERGDLAGARRRLDQSAKERPGDPFVEKLRGDVACARGDRGECLRRYRVALTARPDLRDDPALRSNARRLVAAGEPCGSRRAAAHLLGELRDPESLPALEEARRASGFFARLCLGDSLERAITATKAER